MVDLALIGAAVERGQDFAAGPLLGLVAAGSLVGGYWYGRRGALAHPVIAFRQTMLVFAIGVLPLPLVLMVTSALPPLGVAAAVAGAAIAPNAIAASALVHQLVPSDARTEGFTWLASAAVVGNAGGAALAGPLLDATSSRTVLGVAAALATMAATVPFVARRRLVPVDRQAQRLAGGDAAELP